MKSFGKMLKTACFFCLVMLLLCSFAYPLLLTGASQVTMQARANGSLIDKNGNLTTDPNGGSRFRAAWTAFYRGTAFSREGCLP